MIILRKNVFGRVAAEIFNVYLPCSASYKKVLVVKGNATFFKIKNTSVEIPNIVLENTTDILTFV